MRHIKPPTNQYEPPQTCDIPITEAGVKIGRVKKDNQVVIANKCCSGNHCTIFSDGIVDTSGNGTYLYVKTFEDVQKYH